MKPPYIKQLIALLALVFGAQGAWACGSLPAFAYDESELAHRLIEKQAEPPDALNVKEKVLWKEYKKDAASYEKMCDQTSPACMPEGVGDGVPNCSELTERQRIDARYCDSNFCYVLSAKKRVALEQKMDELLRKWEDRK